jgi:hypothetical protein
MHLPPPFVAYCHLLQCAKDKTFHQTPPPPPSTIELTIKSIPPEFNSQNPLHHLEQQQEKRKKKP